MKTKIDTQVLILVSESREISRMVLTDDAEKPYRLRRLTCPHSNHRPCTLDCAMLGGTERGGGVVFLWCRGTGTRVLLGVPDPSRTDHEELRALTMASKWLEQAEAEQERNGKA
jgi:hypothetical protein